MELVDTTDLSSVGPKGPCGFESHLDYKKSKTARSEPDWSLPDRIRDTVTAVEDPERKALARIRSGRVKVLGEESSSEILT